MQSSALKDEMISLMNIMSESKMRAVVQFARFVMQQNEETSLRKERDDRDLALINACSASLNPQTEENLDFQVDVWGDE